MDLFRRKSVTALQAEAEGDHPLGGTLPHRALERDGSHEVGGQAS